MGGASLKHMKENQKPAERSGEILPSYGSPQVQPELGEVKYIIFRLVKKKRGRTHVDGVCDNVMNPKTGRRERVYLLQGADSIWQSELTELLKDKEYYRRNRMNLIFEDGVCRIGTDEERKLEFARVIKHNVGSRRVGNGKFDFFEYDAAAEQSAKLEKQMLKVNTVVKISQMQEEKMRRLASFLGIVFYDELGQVKETEGIRAELMLRADAQPDLVNKYFDSKEVDISYMVKQAILGTKIDLHGQSGNAIWAEGKGFIAKIPATRKPHEYLTELAMTNSDEGRQFKEQLESIVT